MNKYIRQYEKHEGVHLDPNKIENNPGLRSIGKLALNSFYGKFGLRTDIVRHNLIRHRSVTPFVIWQPIRRPCLLERVYKPMHTSH